MFHEQFMKFDEQQISLWTFNSLIAEFKNVHKKLMAN